MRRAYTLSVQAYLWGVPFVEYGKPPVSIFWNMAMYASDMLFVEDEFGRYGPQSSVLDGSYRLPAVTPVQK